MILGHKDIIEAYNKGDVVISPYDESNVGPNSYDVTLNNKLRVYRYTIDMKSNNPTDVITIPESGLTLEPNVLYLGATNETATSNKYVPMFEGRSSIGRLGISTHVTAGFGDVGFGYVDGVCQYPTWTLEISVVQRVKVYPNVRIGQVFFLKLLSEPDKFYQGKYSCQKEAQPSMLFKDKEFG
jgi:dCTP deaminase